MNRYETVMTSATMATSPITWGVAEYRVNDANQTLLFICADTMPEIYRLTHARKNSEWNKLAAQHDWPIIIHVLCTGTKEECVREASNLINIRKPRCNAIGHAVRTIRCSNGKQYATQTEAAQALGLNQGQLSAHLSGKLRSVKGLTFSYG